MTLVPVLRRLGALSIFVVLVGGSMAFPAATARAEEKVGIGIAPANDSGKPDGRTRFTYLADPGQSATDHVRVTNTGTTALKVTVSAADAYNEDNGDFSLRANGEKQTGASSWVTFDGKPELQLTLPPRAARTIPFTVRVPKDATPGDHAAGLLASATTGGQVTVQRRIADRLYVRVSGKLQPLLTISSFSGVYHSGINPLDGSITVTSTVTNSGNVALEGTATMTAGTWFGLGVGQLYRSQLPEILPGNTSTVSYEVSAVPQVGYAVVSLLVQGGISGDAPDPGPLPVIQRDAFVLAVPWFLVGLIVIGVGVFLLIRWRRKRDQLYAEEWAAEEAPKKAQEVGSL